MIRDFWYNTLRPDIIRLGYLVVLLTLVWGTLFWEIKSDEKQTLAQTAEINDKLVFAFDNHTRHILREVDRYLLFLKTDYEAKGEVSSSVRHLVRMQTNASLMNQSVVTNKYGTPLVSALPGSFSLATAPQFLAHVEADTGMLFIGQPRIGQFSGKESIHFSRRLNNSDGSFAGMVSIAVDPKFFLAVFRDMDPSIGHFACLIGLDRIARVKYNLSEGRAIAMDPLFAALSRSLSGRFETNLASSSNMNYYSYRAIEGYPLVVLVGIDRDIALASFYHRRDGYILGALAISCLIVLYTGLLIRSARRQRQAKWQLGIKKQELELVNKKLEKLAMVDGLTELANRRYFELVMEEEWRRASRNHQPIAIALIDIDRFKNYNDLFGHLFGDDCLRKVSKTITETLKRPGDFVARFGGEEFVVILPNTDLASAVKVCENIRQAIEKLAILMDNENSGRVLTVSIGVSALIPLVDEKYTNVLQKADDALYEAKKSGRNQVQTAVYERN